VQARKLAGTRGTRMRMNSPTTGSRMKASSTATISVMKNTRPTYNTPTTSNIVASRAGRR